MTAVPNGWSSEDASPHLLLARHLAERFGGATRAILHYGSRAQGRHTGASSAFDFFVIVAAYRPAFRSLAATSPSWNRAGRAAALAYLLPPTAVSIGHRLAGGQVNAKCIVISEQHFSRECGRQARDHFVRGRLCQPPVLAWSRDAAARAAVVAGLDAIRLGSIQWLSHALPLHFDVEAYCSTMLRVSLAHELRAERPGHASVLYAAQEQQLLASYRPVLEHLTRDGRLVEVDGAFALTRPPSRLNRVRQTWYFRRSWCRSTLRLLKHPFLYAGWLEYLVSKVHRSTGEVVTLTERERRWPGLFLWPRIIRYFRGRPHRDH